MATGKKQRDEQPGIGGTVLFSKDYKSTSPGHLAKIAKHKLRKATKTFEELSAAERESILKALFLRFGFIRE
jgi:cytochrome b involved in lipid metabolism